MIDFLYNIDLTLFYAINHGLSTPVLSKFFSLITKVDSWLITYVTFVLLLLIKGGKKGRLAVFIVLIMVLVTDQVGAKILKELFSRIRPCDALPDAILPIGKTGAYSFPSNHAFNNFAVATFFSILYKEYRIPLYIAATLIALSRVYLGVHYPSDILGGALLGIGFGWIFAKLHQIADNQIELVLQKRKA